MTGYTPTRPNLLPADGLYGGQALMVGWFNDDGTVAADNGDGTLSLAQDKRITTVTAVGGVAASAVHARPGLTFTAGITADRLVAITLLWVFGDGVIGAGASKVGAGRVAVTDTAPAGAAGVLVQLLAVDTHVVGDYGTILGVAYYDAANVGPFGFYADPAPTDAPLLLSGAVLVPGGTDPGPTPPTPVDNSLGARLYAMLPAMYRADDAATGYTLQRFLAGVSEGANSLQADIDYIAAGGLTDVQNCPDAWLPWLAMCAGIPNHPGIAVDDLRALLVAQNLAPMVGSRAALAALARRYLTGSRIADVMPSPTDQWCILVRVKSSELIPPGDTAALAAKMMATGQVPAGCYVTVFTGLPTWDQIDAAFGPWSDLTGKVWADVDSVGVTGTAGQDPNTVL